MPHKKPGDRSANFTPGNNNDLFNHYYLNKTMHFTLTYFFVVRLIYILSFRHQQYWSFRLASQSPARLTAGMNLKF